MKKLFSLSFILLAFAQIASAKIIPSGSGLTIVGPTTVTVPGNYKVANDFSGTLTIAADDVHVDLGGRRIISGNTSCIEVTGQEDIFISNGLIDSGVVNGILVDTCAKVHISGIEFI